MNRITVTVLTVALAGACAARIYGGRAEDVFPISFWGSPWLTDSLRVEKSVIRRQHGENATFRTQGETITDARLLQSFDLDESVGNQVLATPWILGKQWEWGHDTTGSGSYFWKNPSIFEVPEDTFPDTVARWVEYAVDTFGSHSALLGWALWDETAWKHFRYVENDSSLIDDYYLNLFFHSDSIGDPLDSLSVFSLILHELHEEDTVSRGLVFDRLSAGHTPEAVDANWERSASELKYSDGTCNVLDCMGGGDYEVYYLDTLGDTTEFRDFAAVYDSVANADILYDDGRVHFWPHLQGAGYSGRTGTSGKQWQRILTREELRLMTNLALQHGAKGLFYWRAKPWIQIRPGVSDTSYYAGLLDQNLAPYDAPFEEYVYERHHKYYSDPDTLFPFKNGYDPFSDTLDTKPPVGTEAYYLWKYGPYGRRFNALGDITEAVHRVKHWLLGLWKQEYQGVEIKALGVNPDNLTDSPSIVAMTSEMDGDSVMGSTWALYVNRDFHPAYCPLPCSVKIGVSWPEGAGGSPDTAVLDYSGRRLRAWRFVSTSGSGPGQITWLGLKTRLEAGAGELVHAFITEDLTPRDFTITQPDISFHPTDTVLPDTVRSWLGPFPDSLLDFAVRDTVRLMADVYNLGFTGADSVTVIFYDGDPRYEINEIGSDNVSLSALSDTVPEVDTAMVDWVLPDTSYGVHDIHVVVNHQYEYTDNQVIRRYFHISEADSNNNHAHLPLYIFPLDYATEEIDNPWDMDEDSTLTWRTPDIDTVWGAVLEPDSISGVCELRISGGYPSEPDSMCIYLRVGATEHYIDPDEYYIFRARIYADDPCSLQVFWYDAHDEQKRLPKLPPYVALAGDKWNVVRQDLSQSTWGESVSVDEFGFMIRGRQTDRIRISWVKLTRE